MGFVNYRMRRDAEAEQGRSHAWCMTCGARSKETVDKRAVRDWCIGHAAESRHARFRGVEFTYFVVAPDPERPAAQEES
ncbi:DUF7848 domain-containing protein [Streptomyces sp. NPDC003703]